MLESAPTINIEESTIEDIETIFSDAEAIMEETAPGIQEKRNVLAEKIESMKRINAAAFAGHAACLAKIDTLRAEDEYEKNGTEIKRNIDELSVHMSRIEKSLDILTRLMKEEGKYSDDMLSLNTQVHDSTLAYIGSSNNLLRYYRAGFGEIETMRKLYANLEDCKQMYEPMALEVQVLYKDDLQKIDSLMKEIDQTIQETAGVKYKEGTGLVIDKEVKQPKK